MPLADERLLVWGRDGIEDNTIEQAARASRLPFVEKPMALMPDAHFGIGATVGSVIATSGAIIPAAVGVDIGCGMIAARLQLRAHQLPDDLDAMHSRISAAVPAGVGQGHNYEAGAAEWFLHQPRTEPEILTEQKQAARARSQFGTLGSGNHFVEVCTDQDDRVWVLLHSGSRGIGNTIAQRHIAEARGIMARYFIELEDPDLAYFVEQTAEFDAYISDMLWAQDYAAANRERMLDLVFDAMRQLVPVQPLEVINCHHNYTEKEHHHDRDLWVTRKGAIRAREHDRGIVPGSMATGSYIVEGLGNPASYNSCSHGAGRRMSRGQARKTVTEEQLRESMKGKAWNDADAKTLLDESPEAYKPIEDVMAAQSDLVRVRDTLTQVLNYKGT